MSDFRAEHEARLALSDVVGCALAIADLYRDHGLSGVPEATIRRLVGAVDRWRAAGEEQQAARWQARTDIVDRHTPLPRRLEGES